MLNEFILPGLFELNILNREFIKYCAENRNQMNEDYEIFGVYGNFPFCIWNGETVNFSENAVLNNLITQFFLDYAGFHKCIFLNCTNTEITEDMLDDTYSNIILNNLHKITASNHIVINSSLLNSYIQSIYKNNLCIDIGKYNEILPETILNLNDEGYLFINPKFNNNFELLKKYKNKKQLIMTLNPSLCVNQCNIYNECLLKEHLAQIAFDPRKSRSQSCLNWNNNCELQNIRNSNLYISYQDIEKYNKISINHFLLEYYNNVEDTLQEYISFLIKPEYWQEVFNILKIYTV